MINHRRSQMKIQEMSFMLLALVLFFIIAGLFFLIVSNSSLKKDYEALSRGKTISSVATLAAAPELSCGEQVCIDADKLLSLKNSAVFGNFWEMAGLVVKKVYPYSSEEIECNADNFETCNVFTLKKPDSGFVEVSSFVSLCRKEAAGSYNYDKCELGIVSAYMDKK